ncbi:hypothetical protein VKT23_013004 [Stygiomarasmius scandens]|uniref:ARID domain-containing protein n=1 Tax=Marasmiellus scandens TaxID=2682957 RepID=A0ABR1J6V8_9AGAR
MSPTHEQPATKLKRKTTVTEPQESKRNVRPKYYQHDFEVDVKASESFSVKDEKLDPETVPKESDGSARTKNIATAPSHVQNASKSASAGSAIGANGIMYDGGLSHRDSSQPEDVTSPPMHVLNIPPLAKDRFLQSFKVWCQQKDIFIDQRLLDIDGHPIDLYSLHEHVIREGGLGSVQAKDLWAVISARMGFVRPPGDPSAIVKHLDYIYKEYLAAFDAVYIASLENKRKKLMRSARTDGNGTSLGDSSQSGGSAPQQTTPICSIPPLTQQRFNSSFEVWCQLKSISVDQQLLSIDDKLIDLYSLHKCVIQEGLGNVQAREMWDIIGAQMGLVQNDSLKSGSAVAKHLAHVYKEYLAPFDAVYIASWKHKHEKLTNSHSTQPARHQHYWFPAQLQDISDQGPSSKQLHDLPMEQSTQNNSGPADHSPETRPILTKYESTLKSPQC